MKQKTKNRIKIFGLTIFGLFIILSSIVYVFLDCWYETGIRKNSLYCYVCITANIRNFPLIGLEGEPEYVVNQNVGEPNSSHPPYYSVDFSSNKSAQEILSSASEYFVGNSFELIEKNCLNSDSTANCSVIYAGENSILEISINLKTPIDGKNLTRTNSISVIETFIEDVKTYKEDKIRLKELTKKAKEENLCAENKYIRNVSEDACISKNIGEFPLVGLTDNLAFDSDILLGQNNLSFHTQSSTKEVIGEAKKYFNSIGFSINKETVCESGNKCHFGEVVIKDDECLMTGECYMGEFESADSRISISTRKDSRTDYQEKIFVAVSEIRR